MIMYPWKVWGQTYYELTDTTNIDYSRGVSGWKVDLLDVDPVSGKVYLGKLKAGLGDIVKAETLMPPKSWDDKYEEISNDFKKKLQQAQREADLKDKIKAGDTDAYKSVINDIKKNKDKYMYTTKGGIVKFEWNKILRDYKRLGVKTDDARQIKRDLEREYNGE